MPNFKLLGSLPPPCFSPKRARTLCAFLCLRLKVAGLFMFHYVSAKEQQRLDELL